MTATRSRKQVKDYRKHRKNAKKPDGCTFCLIDSQSSQYISETKHFKVIRNIFGYSLWDSQKVADHLMVVPKKHTDSLSKLPKEAAVEFVDIISTYEDKRYNIYARAPASVMKTVVHQHTHLIKPLGKPRRFIFFLRKPYIRFIAG